jgi:Bacterial capsule synthesis protein PGA_cap
MPAPGRRVARGLPFGFGAARHNAGIDTGRRSPAGTVLALCLGALLALSSCADPEPQALDAGTTSPANPTPAAVGTTEGAIGAATSPAAGPTTSLTEDSPITLAFGGDVHFEGRLAQLVATPDGLNALEPVLGKADVAMVNLETAITDRGVEQPKIYHFRTTPNALVTLQHAGIDAVSMANNHAVDYGPDGLADTLAAQASSPIPVVGIGANAEQAFAPAVFRVRGTTVAVIASTQINDYTVHTYPATDTKPGVAGNLDNARLLQAVRKAREAYDVVVVFLHWGSDYTSCPDEAQTATATALAGAGVDVVVGGHAHRVQGAGWLGRTYVDYGLGNFVWLNTRGPDDAVSGVLSVSVDPARARQLRGTDVGARRTKPTVVTRATWTPLLIDDAGVPRPPNPGVAANQLAAWNDARSCARLAGTP